VQISGGLLKASDVVLELRSTPITLPDEARSVGVLVDHATYCVTRGEHGIITPYPAQVVYGGIACALLWLGLPLASFVPLSSISSIIGRVVLVAAGGLLFLLCYRLQPPMYPYPLHWLLPAAVAVLLVLLVVRVAPAVVLHYRLLPDALAVAGVAGWLWAILAAAQEHVTLSVPGVEKDFRVFATRATELERVFQADGFYNLGYPFVLWLVQPLTGHNVFLAARLIAALSGAVLLLAGYWLARRVCLPASGYRLCALLALLMLAFSPLVVQYALYVGSDMPFAACTALSLVLLVWAGDNRHSPPFHQARYTLVLTALAGLAAGCAFLVRHLGMVLLPWGVVSCIVLFGRMRGNQQRADTTKTPPPHAVKQWWWPQGWKMAAVFAVGFGIAVLPQLVINTVQTGQPWYSQQAKNIWLAVYAGVDWGRWHEAPDSIGLAEVVLRNPQRFVRNWWVNLVEFTGSGAEDVGETGRAVQLRLLGWPANWLAVVGLVGWLVQLALRRRSKDSHKGCDASMQRQAHEDEGARDIYASLLLFVLLYVLLVCVAFILPRFFLLFTPVYAAAAAWLVQRATRAVPPLAAAGGHACSEGRTVALTEQAVLRRQVIIGVVLLVLVWGSFRVGTRYVLEHQPADERAIVQVVQDELEPGAQLLARVSPEVPLAKYSAVAHRSVPWPDGTNGTNGTDGGEVQAVLDDARKQGIRYLLWDSHYGPPPLDNLSGARVGEAGPYGVYRLGSGGMHPSGDHLWECKGTRFPHAPHSGRVYGFFDEVEKTIYPTAKPWHATTCAFSPAQTVPAPGAPSPNPH
jgi:hypothetical protein